MQLVARVDFADQKIGQVRKGQPFEVADNHGARLIRLRCAVPAEDGAPYQTKVVRPMPDPMPAGGEDHTSSASPPAQASPRTTAKPSSSGDSTKRRKNKGT